MCTSDSSSEHTMVTIEVAPEVLAHVVDVHCHPTDSPLNVELMNSLSMRICAMATRGSDQAIVRDLAVAYPDKVIPCFGYHPWFSHWIAVKPFASKEHHYKDLFLGTFSKPEHIQAFEKLLPSLPEPTILSDIIEVVRESLLAYPDAMVGEVGIDRACRIPYGAPSPPPYALDTARRELSPFTIPLDHQLAILQAHFDLAVELRRNVSFHSVKCQQATVEFLDRQKSKHGDAWSTISVDMHSCGLSAQTWKDVQKRHSNVFLSLSVAINSRSTNHRDLIAVCSPERILAESDYHDVSYSTGQTWQMLRTIAEVKGWEVEAEWQDPAPASESTWGVVRRLEHNWNLFQKGGHKSTRKKDKHKLLLEDWESDEENKLRPID